MNKNSQELTILNHIKHQFEQDLKSLHIVPDWSRLTYAKKHSLFSIKSLTYVMMALILIFVVGVSISVDAPQSPSNDVFMLSNDEDIYHISSIASVSLLPNVSVPVEPQQPLSMLALSDETLLDMKSQLHTYMSLVEKWLASSDALTITTSEIDGAYMYETTYKMVDLLGNDIMFVTQYNMLEDGSKQGVIFRDDEMFEFESKNDLENEGSYELITYKSDEDYTKITYDDAQASMFVVEVYRMNQMVSVSNLTIQRDEDAFEIDVDVDTISFQASYAFRLGDERDRIKIDYTTNDNLSVDSGTIDAILIYDDTLMIYRYELRIVDGSGVLTVSDIVRSMENDGVSLTFDQLLETIQQVIEIDFSQYVFESATYDDGKFIIRLSEGVKLYFNPVGKLMSTEGVADVEPIEEEDVPQEILNFIEAEYPRLKIKRIEKTIDAYVITMTANVTLLFTLEGTFIDEVPTNSLESDGLDVV